MNYLEKILNKHEASKISTIVDIYQHATKELSLSYCKSMFVLKYLIVRLFL